MGHTRVDDSRRVKLLMDRAEPVTVGTKPELLTTEGERVKSEVVKCKCWVGKAAREERPAGTGARSIDHHHEWGRCVGANSNVLLQESYIIYTNLHIHDYSSTSSYIDQSCLYQVSTV